MSYDAKKQAQAYLYDHHVMTLATSGPKGIWAAALFYASRDFTLIFLSAAHTRHAQNIAASSRVSATIQENYEKWEDIKGIQLEGIVQELKDEDRESAIKQYMTKFPFISEADSSMSIALTKVSWYQLLPDKLYFIDNSKGLGYRTEILLTS
jgi:uncharacterized protein YhbP (UPF0306 family)